jgi:hypothetical protein
MITTDPAEFRVGGQELAPWVHSAPAQAVLRLPGCSVAWVRGSITLPQILSHRPSYINAILIQSRGRPERRACLTCRRSISGPRPFPECRRVPGHFGGACGNCKWRDHASRCTVRDGLGEEQIDGDNDSDESEDPIVIRPMVRPVEIEEVDSDDNIKAEEITNNNPTTMTTTRVHRASSAASDDSIIEISRPQLRLGSSVNNPINLD